jgi:CRISPR-associated protein Csm1
MDRLRLEAALSTLLYFVGKLYQSTSELNANTKQQTKGPDSQAWFEQLVGLINSDYQQYVIDPTVDAGDDQNKSSTKQRINIGLQLSSSKSPMSIGKRSDTSNHLRSIFDSVSLSESQNGNNDPPNYLPLKPLSLEESHIFPGGDQDISGSDYQELVSRIMAEAKKEFAQPERYLENLLAGLNRYGWCIPVDPEMGSNDISIFDQARTTAALAVCLSDFKAEELEKIMQAISLERDGQPTDLQDHPVALLVGGDISGIQDFIYTLSAKKAAKTLRGRSFYLQLLTEAILRFVLRRLDLPFSNVIYAGGGHFFLLAPTSAQETLPTIQKEISQKLLGLHGIRLYLGLGWTSIPINGFLKNTFSLYWDMMHSELQNRKLRRYTELGNEEFEHLFFPGETGGDDELVCSVCNREDSTVHKMAGDFEAEEEIRICDTCQSFADQIGGILPKADFVKLGFGEPFNNTGSGALAGLALFGTQVRFDRASFEHPVENTVLWDINDQMSLRGKDHTEIVWPHFTVNELPLDSQNQIITFDALMQQDKEGISRLGVLRMDVDHLGLIFKQGLVDAEGNPKGSLVHLAALSFQISLFFEGWLKKILQSSAYNNLIYAVYSGGDDLFLIGPWKLMPQLALDITDSLNQYTGENPDIHLSGGLGFIHGKYPVHSAAEDAGDLERDAKSAFGNEKNAFAFLGGIWHWDTFKEVKGFKDLIVSIVKEQDSPRSLIQLIKQLSALQMKAKQARDDNRPLWGPWMWMGDYQIQRMIQRAKSQPLRGSLQRLQQSLHAGTHPYARLDDWGTAARWAELELRKRNN